MVDDRKDENLANHNIPAALGSSRGCKIFLFHPSEFATIVKYDDGDYYSNWQSYTLVGGSLLLCYPFPCQCQMDGLSAMEIVSEKLLTSLLSISPSPLSVCVCPRDFGN